MKLAHRNIVISLIIAGFLLTCTLTNQPAHADQHIGINVILKCAPTDALLAELGCHGQVLGVIPEIRAAILSAASFELTAIRALSFVAGANPDRERTMASSTDGLPVSDLSRGSTCWNLDAINVTDAVTGRTIPYDGQGVYVAVIDSGLPHNWRAYFPEHRIDTVDDRAFGGGGGEKGTISSEPGLWENDTLGHGNAVTSIILGFAYTGKELLPAAFNGVAPGATIIPVKIDSNHGWYYSSVISRAIVYVAKLKANALGGAPVVINLSNGGFEPDVLERTAIDYAIANGVVVVAAAGNEGDSGMRWPAAYPEVISVANAGWGGQFPADDLTGIAWILRDVLENNDTQFFISPDSSRERPGQELDVSAPGWVPVAFTQDGRVEYSFFVGTSGACPHVAGIAALMLQKNKNLTQAQVEFILKSTALTLSPGCRDVTFPAIGPGNPPTWGDHSNVFYFPFTVCWGANATGAGLLQADKALAATPMP